MADLTASQANDLAGAQRGQLTSDLNAFLTECHDEAIENQNLADGVAGAAVQQQADDATAQVEYNTKVTEAAVLAEKNEVDAARSA